MMIDPVVFAICITLGFYAEQLLDLYHMPRCGRFVLPTMWMSLSLLTAFVFGSFSDPRLLFVIGVVVPITGRLLGHYLLLRPFWRSHYHFEARGLAKQYE